jgi:hypothetical protein
MNVAIPCIALLGLLVFGLGLRVSMLRGASKTNFGYVADPTDPLYKTIRAHGNAAEFAPMMAIMILLVAWRGATPWMLWTFVAATIVRYLHAAGMILCPTLDRPHPLRFVGAVGTYVTGLALVVATFMVA